MIRLCTLVLLSTLAVEGKISIDVDIETGFASSDLVCRGRLAAVTALSREDAIDATKALTPVDYDMVFSNAWCYKGTIQAQGFTVRIHRTEPTAGRPGGLGGYFLVFLKRTQANIFVPETFTGAMSAYWEPKRPAEAGRAGLALLQQEVISQSVDPRQSRQALEFLLWFRHVDPQFQTVLASLARSQDADVRLLSLEARLKSPGVPNRRELLHEFAVALSAPGRAPEVFPGIGEMKSVIADSTIGDFQVLKELVRCPYPMIRSFAMDAIRKLRAPRTMSFLLEQMDSKDPEVQYTAVITLAEIADKGGEFGPAWDTFQSEPAKYIGLWKQWWREEGSRRFAGAR